MFNEQKCYHCKYYVKEAYNNNWCKSPKNMDLIIEQETFKQIKVPKYTLVKMNNERCGYKPILSRYLSILIGKLRLKYIKKYKPELLLKDLKVLKD